MVGILYVTSDEIEKFDAARAIDALNVTADVSMEKMFARLASGKNAVVTMGRIATGIRLPQGVQMVFSETCPTSGPLRAQAESRAHFQEQSVALPVKLHSLTASPETVASLVRGMGKLPAPAAAGHDVWADIGIASGDAASDPDVEDDTPQPTPYH